MSYRKITERGCTLAGASAKEASRPFLAISLTITERTLSSPCWDLWKSSIIFCLSTPAAVKASAIGIISRFFN
jgi:hypothetical protein